LDENPRSQNLHCRLSGLKSCCRRRFLNWQNCRPKKPMTLKKRRSLKRSPTTRSLKRSPTRRRSWTMRKSRRSRSAA
jgi:hypothetical protein